MNHHGVSQIRKSAPGRCSLRLNRSSSVDGSCILGEPNSDGAPNRFCQLSQQKNCSRVEEMQTDLLEDVIMDN